MSFEFSSELNAELLDDFYSECDEHLTAIRQGLMALESSIGKTEKTPAGLDKLFRTFHSFKGNAGTVGLRPAENLAHCAEDLLRELSQGKMILTSRGMDLLMNAVQWLEQVVAAHREKQPGPDVSPLMEEFKQFLAKPAAAQPDEKSVVPGPLEPVTDLAHEIEESRGRGLGIWRFTFAPSRDLDQRGINVNSIRARLREGGKILQSMPHVHRDGSVVFEFITALRETPSNLLVWEEDGVTVQPYEDPSSSAEATAPGERGAAAGVAGASQGPFVAPSHIVRVDLGRLDELMRITGEMVIHRARLEDQINRLAARDPGAELRGLLEVNLALARDLRELRENIIRVRLVPVSEIFARMPFVVRDLSRETGKEVRLTIEGQQTEIDKYLVERLKDPLLHLVRNSISHGVENPSDRAAAGKPAVATIFLRASAFGDNVLIEMGDDGRGIDVVAVKNRANELGLPVPANLTGTALLNLLCLPGFSTREQADRGSGRGVGMAVVNNIVRELGGTLSLETDNHRGSKFSIRLPLTLAVADVFIISAEEQTCAVPQSFVQEIIQMANDQVRVIDGTEVIPYRNGILPLIRLRSMFQMPSSPRATLPMLVLSSERGQTGLVVDRIQGQREVVVSAARDPLIQVPGIAGATELGDGRPVLILDAAALTAGIVRPHENGHSPRADRPALAIAI